MPDTSKNMTPPETGNANPERVGLDTGSGAGSAPVHPYSSCRGLLIAEGASEWQDRFSAFTGQGIRIDASESAMDGLIALKRASSEGLPYRLILLGSRIQGMDASILSSAIKGDAAGRGASLVFLSERDAEDEAALARAGFSALITRNAAPDAILRVLEGVWNATNPEFASTACRPSPSAERRILIADDNPVNREVAARMLEKFGYECAHAGNGREAVDMHCSQPFDMILMDCEMPEMDGLQATALIRSQAGPSSHTPVIALTASTAQDEREKCLAAGMDDFLSKPIRPQVLSDVLARWLPASIEAQPGTDSAPLEDELDAVHAMFGADFSELVHLYQRDTPPRMEALHRAYAERNCPLVAKVAHALGGSSASIGATGLSGLCKTLETRAREGALDEFEKTMADIENEYRRISSRLQSMIG